MSVITQGYVFAALPNAPARLAGTLSLKQTSGSFVYADSWLAAEHAYPLDPVNLPLSTQRFICSSRSRVPGVLSDAGPDDWGTKVLLHGHSRLPANELERLLACSGQGVGNLRFSLSRTRPKEPPPLPSLELLEVMERAARDLAAHREVDERIFQLLVPGSSMGGARPKVSLQDASGAWLVKFALPQDPYDQPLVENATLHLAGQAGIRVPMHRLKALGERHALLVKRFDRDQSAAVHFISAHSLFNQDRIRQFADALHDPAGYPALARILRAHARHPQADCEELYRRMIFNVLIGNTDDHGQNHALLHYVGQEGWHLAPAYDLQPIPSGSLEHALGIGRRGREGSVDNLLSIHAAFGLKEADAREEIARQLSLVTKWKAHYREHRVQESSLGLLERIIEPRLSAARAALGTSK